MNKRQLGESAWREKFANFGFSTYFDFICRDWESDHGRLAVIKCKTCGNEFNSWNVRECFRGKVKSFCCPQCGTKSDGSTQWTKSELCNDVMAYYLQGHTTGEVVEKFNVTAPQFEGKRKALGITKKPEQRKESWRKSLDKAVAIASENTKARSKKKRSERLDSLGFDVVDENDGVGTIRCRTCGSEFSRTLQYMSCGNVMCCECNRITKQEETERKRTRKIRPKALCYQEKREKLLDSVCICKTCGKQYTPRMYCEDANLKTYSNPGFCSVSCKKKNSRSKQSENKNYRERAKKFGCEYDKTVTLKKLIKRDGLKCRICGGMCNQNDHEWTDFFGPTSPTLDHIIPLAKGGGHVWENVQVAHAICNSRKKDDIEVVLP